MRIGVIIPDRGDRPEFMKNCLRMVNGQTLKPFRVFPVGPLTIRPSDQCDITVRYCDGYNAMSLSYPKIDVISFMENDDWYSPEYLETMARAWHDHGRPDIFGVNYTIYYHLGERAYFTMTHPDRSSAMSTFIKPGLHIRWPVDNDPFTDMHLWQQLKGVTFNPGKLISIGMKHGIGMCGGRNHTTRLERYRMKDPDFKFLRQNLDEESFEFYSTIYENTFSRELRG